MTPHEHIVNHLSQPWYDGSGGLIIFLVTAVAVTASFITIAILMAGIHVERLTAKRQADELALTRKHDLAIEEQRTVQADMSKGDIEFLKTLRSDG